MGRAVPLHLLREWLLRNEIHETPDDPHEEVAPFVFSLELDLWARENAVERVVVKKVLGGDTKDIWYFHEHGWHKAGPPCNTHVTQSQARIVRVIKE
jgi:hypothetical protein